MLFRSVGSDARILQVELEQQIMKLQQLLPVEIYGFDHETMAGSAGELLASRHARLAVAESCTGGHLSHLLTLTPGASSWFTGGIVAYDNEVKTKILGVSPDTLRDHGAVSEQTVKEMVKGLKKIMKSDYAIATTGIAGPEGGTDQKPVGTVWIAIAGPAKFIAQKFVFDNNQIGRASCRERV